MIELPLITQSETAGKKHTGQLDPPFTNDVTGIQGLLDAMPNLLEEKHNTLANAQNENNEFLVSEINKKVNADIVYTSEEVDDLIDEKIVEIGTADMTKAEYAGESNGYVANADNATSADNGVFSYVHSVTDDVNTLTGTGTNGKFKATSSDTVTSFTIGSTEYDVKVGEDSEIEIVEGAWYSFIVDSEDSTINFKSGGAGLDIKVVGGTVKPTSPKENTIWIDDDYWLTHKPVYTIGYDMPTSPAIRQIFFKIDGSENAYLYVDKHKVVEVSIDSACYWSGTDWINLTFEVFADNEWKKTYYYIFTNGIFDEEFTDQIKIFSNSYALGSLFTNDGNTLTGYINGSLQNQGNSGYFDLTDYSKLEINFSHTNTNASRFNVSIGENPTVLPYSGNVLALEATSFTGVKTLNIEDYTGVQNIAVYLMTTGDNSGTSTVNINSIKLIK